MRYGVDRLAIALLAVSVLGYGARAEQDSPPRVAAEGQPPPPIPSEELPAGAEVLNRGPVNEAFAEPVSLEPQAGLVAPKQPPADIQEVPPDYKPEGSRYVWVPGYWSWDADRNDYIWVSACWRVAPPNMYWVPGYWVQVNDGWEWVPGFWTPAGTRDIEYLPAPPAPADLQAPSVPPAPDTVWVPGCWYWSRGHYTWRPGYWLSQRPGWVWVPSHYSWTPRGWVFVEGHWDYPLEQRGVLFAPVYFPQSVILHGRFAYSPSIVIDIGILSVHLFAYPRYSHYYFGDYYDDAYVRVGIYPQFESVRIRTWYDPIYVHERWRHRDNPRWEDRHRRDYERRRDDRSLRPLHTYREMQRELARLPEPQRRNVELSRPLHSVVTRKSGPVRFERVDAEARQNISRRGSEVHRYREERGAWERSAPAAAPGGEHRPAAPTPSAPSRTPGGQKVEPAVPPKQAAPPAAAPPAAAPPAAAPPAERRGEGRLTPERRQAPAPQGVARPPAASPPVSAPVAAPPAPPQTPAPTTPTPQAEGRRSEGAPERRMPPAAPAEVRTGPAGSTAERRGGSLRQATPPAEVVPPREVHRTEPERVRVPAPPVVADPKEEAGRKAPPPAPRGERRREEEQRRDGERERGRK